MHCVPCDFTMTLGKVYANLSRFLCCSDLTTLVLETVGRQTAFPRITSFFALLSDHTEATCRTAGRGTAKPLLRGIINLSNATAHIGLKCHRHGLETSLRLGVFSTNTHVRTWALVSHASRLTGRRKSFDRPQKIGVPAPSHEGSDS